MSDPRLLRRLAELILSEREFSADDVTNDGEITAAGDHAPNASQNSIGSLFRTASSRRWVKQVDTTNSKAPHRKGGLIRTWIGTAKGEQWAVGYLKDHPDG